MLKYKKIKDGKQYDQYCALHEQMFMEDDVKYNDELELLEVLIDEYEARLKREDEINQNLDPVELLKAIIEDNGMTQSQLAHKVNKSKQLISDILNYRRHISKDLIFALAELFSMRPEAFARPYELKGRREEGRVARLGLRDTR
jgi:HTH-type transcriptional regulator/antitoxin HigA